MVGTKIVLREYTQFTRANLEFFFSVALPLVDHLRSLHQRGIVHLDLRPDTIFIEPETGTVSIFPPVSSGFRPGGNRSQGHLSIFDERRLPYISPEQTGRIGRPVDHRSDLYSLGVAFYELLTGRLPFQAGDDPLEWFHAHLARRPAPPHELNPAVPRGLSDVVLRLLAKAVEERYQSAGGLKADLEHCYRQWTLTGTVDPFPLGRQDVPGRLRFLPKLYGREQEILSLQAALAHTCRGKSGLVLISGPPGVGKTALANELRNSVLSARGYFIQGKFEQFQEDIPYVVLVRAVQDLVRQILGESPAQVARWQAAILEGVGAGGAVIAELVPEVKLITGSLPAAPGLPPAEARNRLLLALRNFLRVFARQEHPLVVFLDDLQWADPASLQLLASLLTDPDLRHVLCLASYRDNEVDASHPLFPAVATIENAGIAVRRIVLEGLDLAGMQRLVAETLRCGEEEAASLAALLWRRTAGNCFHARQLLSNLYEEGLLAYDFAQQVWRWDANEIRKKEIPAGVVDLVLRRLDQLPPHTRNALQVAACMGSTFSLHTLALVCRQSLTQTIADLRSAAELDIVIPREGRSPADGSSGEEEDSGFPAGYEFLHDQVQQAVYSLLSPAEKKEVHYRVGRLMLQGTDPDLVEREIFTIVDHLNQGGEAIASPGERRELSFYNLLAGRKAYAAVAFPAALRYLETGVAFLPEDSWRDDYRLTFDLHLELCRCRYLCNQTEAAEELFQELLQRAREPADRADLYSMKSVLCISWVKYAEGVRLGLMALGTMGMQLPARPGKPALMKEVLLTRLRLPRHRIAALAGQAEMTAPGPRKCMDLLATLLPPASVVNHELFSLVCLKMLHLSLEHGHAPFTPVACSGYGIVASSVLGDFRTSGELQRIALEMVDRGSSPQAKCQVYFATAFFLNHWHTHLANSLAYARQAYRYALEGGLLMYVGTTLARLVQLEFLAGEPLGEVYQECESSLQVTERLQMENLSRYLRTARQFILNLQGATDSPFSFSNEDYDEDSMAAQIVQSRSGAVVLGYYLFKIQSAYLHGDPLAAFHLARRLQGEMGTIRSMMLFAEHHFWYALTITAAYRELDAGLQREAWRALRRNLRQMEKWAASCPDNFRHKCRLVAAEMARLRGDISRAMPLYQEAVDLSRQSGFRLDAAVACELAARFYLERGLEQVAAGYLGEAYQGYRRWGATRKAEYLVREHPRLLAGALADASEDGGEVGVESPSGLAGTVAGPAGDLDLVTLARASTRLSGELDLERSLQDLLALLIANAGAQKGYLILARDDRLVVVAGRDADQDQVSLLPAIPVAEGRQFSPAVIYYVSRTRQPVVLGDAAREGAFAADPYIAQTRPRSVLCLPVLAGEKLTGILYLENNLVPHAFSPERLTVLEGLSSQAVNLKLLQEHLEKTPPAAVAQEAGQERPFTAPLSQREREILELMVAGLSNRQIAARLYLAEGTVKWHVNRIFAKLEVTSRTQAVLRAQSLRLSPKDQRQRS